MTNRLIILSSILFSSLFAHAQLKNISVQNSEIKLYSAPTTTNFGEKNRRLALVVGVANYQHADLSDLPNDNNDVDSISTVLTQLKFDVISLKDANYKSFNEAITIFSGQLKSGIYKASLFYYTGHGEQWGEINYLIPADYKPPIGLDTSDIMKNNLQVLNNYNSRTIKLHEILEDIREANVEIKLSFIDACRTKPGKDVTEIKSFINQSFDASKIIEDGNYILFANTAGMISSAGIEFGLKNSVFTHCLLKHIREPIDFPYFVAKVNNTSKNSYYQRPYPKGNAPTNFYFVDNVIPKTNEMTISKKRSETIIIGLQEKTITSSDFEITVIGTNRVNCWGDYSNDGYCNWKGSLRVRNFTNDTVHFKIHWPYGYSNNYNLVQVEEQDVKPNETINMNFDFDIDQKKGVSTQIACSNQNEYPIIKYISLDQQRQDEFKRKNQTLYINKIMCSSVYEAKIIGGADPKNKRGTRIFSRKLQLKNFSTDTLSIKIKWPYGYIDNLRYNRYNAVNVLGIETRDIKLLPLEDIELDFTFKFTDENRKYQIVNGGLPGSTLVNYYERCRD